MTIDMNASVKRCVTASAEGDSRDCRTSGARQSSVAAATKSKIGALRKKRSGTQTGGACSNRRAVLAMQSSDALEPPADAAARRYARSASTFSTRLRVLSPSDRSSIG